MTDKLLSCEVRKRSFNGAWLTLAVQPFLLICQLTSTAFLARIITPADYGVMAMALSLISLFSIVGDLGLSHAAVQAPDLSKSLRSNLFWINLGWGSILFAGGVVMAPLVATFYQQPEVAEATAALSCSFLILGFGSQSGAKIMRDMRFGIKIFAEVSGKIFEICITIYLALSGYGFWSLVIGNLAGLALQISFLFLFSPVIPEKFKINSEVKECFRFGITFSASKALVYINQTGASVGIGYFSGPAATGLYNRANSLVRLPLNSIAGVISNVLFPTLSRMQGDLSQFRYFFSTAHRVICISVIPLLVLMAFLAEDLVSLMLGDQWMEAVSLFQVLAVGGILNSPFALVSTTLLSLGHPKTLGKLNLVRGIFVILSIVIGARFGTMGIVIAIVFAEVLTFLGTLYWAFRDLPIKATEYLNVFLSPVLAAVGSIGLSFYFWLEIPIENFWLSIVGKSVLFLSVYLLLILLLPHAEKNKAILNLGWRKFRYLMKNIVPLNK